MANRNTDKGMLQHLEASVPGSAKATRSSTMKDVRGPATSQERAKTRFRAPGDTKNQEKMGALLTVAVCTYNRGMLLPRLIGALRAQSCPIPYEILVIINNSTDETGRILHQLCHEDGAPLRFVTERSNGIVHARNRAIAESLDSDFILFIDDDELPHTGLLKAAIHALRDEKALCAGGRIRVMIGEDRPSWLGDELLGFLGELDHGDSPFWVSDWSTPIWSGNIAYSTAMFKADPGLRFDVRYNRSGSAVGGGEDAIILKEFLRRNYPVRYRPDMIVEHLVEATRLRRTYFLKLHFMSGYRYGRYSPDSYERHLLGVPPFMLRQALVHLVQTASMSLKGEGRALRQGMSASHSLGCICGRFTQWFKRRVQRKY